MRRNDLTPQPNRPGSRCLADFRGRWRLDRSIRHQDGQTARFEGHADWTPDGDALWYRESGLLIVPGQARMTASQCYIWHPDLTVCFPDGRFFHRVPVAGGDTAHWCEPDQYDGRYDFSAWPCFTVTWRVRGPRKAYLSHSDYSRPSS